MEYTNALADLTQRMNDLESKVDDLEFRLKADIRSIDRNLDSLTGDVRDLERKS